MKHRILSSLLLAAALTSSAAEAPKYIFYFIGDGMGPGQVMAADTYRRLVEKQPDKLLMLQFPVASLCTTYSASSPVTDSAAAGTALSTGVKTTNNMLGMSPDSVAVSSVANDLHAAGYGIGLVTNVCPDDATPGAFYAHVPNRGMFHQIGLQAADSPVKFLAGSHMRGAFSRGKYNGLYEDMAAKGLTTVRGVEALAEVDAPRILLLNAADTISDNAGYVIDKPQGWNILSDFTQAAMNHLGKHSPDRYFLMVEGGNIDWAGHDNDAATIAREVLAYNQTLQLAYDFYLAHPDETLIIVTADHETGGMTVGQKSTGYNCYPAVIDNQRMSKAQFNNLCDSLLNDGSQIAWEDMKQLLSDKLGFYSVLPISEENDKRLQETFGRTFITRNDYYNDALYHRFPEFVEEAYTIMNEIEGFGFTTAKHSGNPVPVYAVGVGSERFGAPLDNTDIPKIIREIITSQE